MRNTIRLVHRLTLLTPLFALACAQQSEYYCDEDTPCLPRYPDRPHCDLTGEHEPDGIRNTCVPDPQVGADGGVVDAGATADGPVRDASPDDPDAADQPDAAPPSPPVVTGQAADLVLGQPNFTANTSNNGGLDSGSLSHPMGVATDGTRLWVYDVANQRVLQFNALPQFNGTNASAAIGQSSLSMTEDGPTQVLFANPPFVGGNQVAAGGGRVVATDSGANRVLLWNSVPSMTAGTPADLVLGQTSFTGQGFGSGSSQMDGPRGVWTDGNRIAVADADNHRVLLWNSWPVANGSPPNLILGTGAATAPPTASSLAVPTDVYFDGQRLIVTDHINHRVLIWDGWPTSNGQAADVVVGQPNFTVNNANAGATGPVAPGLQYPTGAIAIGNSLFVADAGNLRVLVYTPVPTSNGAVPAAVLGQDDFVSELEATSDKRFGAHAGNGFGAALRLAASAGALWVADQANHRVLRFELND